jgi:hypothetical protein
LNEGDKVKQWNHWKLSLFYRKNIIGYHYRTLMTVTAMAGMGWENPWR